MKLKAHVTKEMLEELGFAQTSNPNEYSCKFCKGISFASVHLLINLITRDINIFMGGIVILDINDLLLKMFKLDYIEESELE